VERGAACSGWSGRLRGREPISKVCSGGVFEKNFLWTATAVATMRFARWLVPPRV
jgi:hypothetical protein